VRRQLAGTGTNVVSDSVESRIRQMIVERCFLSIAPEQIGDLDDLVEAVGLDSVQVLEVVVGLEETFGITFEDADFDIANFRNVGSIARYVRSKVAG
jgi:acyl carrier protein